MTAAEMLDDLVMAGWKNGEICWRCGLASRDAVLRIRRGVSIPDAGQLRSIEKLHRREIMPKNTVCGPPLRGKLGCYP